MKGSPVLNGSKHRTITGSNTEKHWSKWGDPASFPRGKMDHKRWRTWMILDFSISDWGLQNTRAMSSEFWRKKDIQCWILPVLWEKKRHWQMLGYQKLVPMHPFFGSYWKICATKGRKKPRKRMTWDMWARKDGICRRMIAKALWEQSRSDCSKREFSRKMELLGWLLI